MMYFVSSLKFGNGDETAKRTTFLAEDQLSDVLLPLSFQSISDKGRYCIILPASVAHGFAASLICLISWRLLSKLC